MFQTICNNITTQLSINNTTTRLGQVLINWSQIRNRRYVAFREYLQPHYRQKLLLAVCEPVFKRSNLPTSEKCGHHLNPSSIKKDHPLDVILANEMKNEFNKSKLICLFHQNQMSSSDRRLLSNEFEHEEMFLRYYNRDIARICLQSTSYQSMLHFAIGYYFTILFVPKIEKIDKIFTILKKYPQIILMCALVEHRRLITIEQLQKLTKLNNLDQQRLLLCNTLMTLQQQTISSLNYHQSQLKQLINIHHDGMK